MLFHPRRDHRALSEIAYRLVNDVNRSCDLGSGCRSVGVCHTPPRCTVPHCSEFSCLRRSAESLYDPSCENIEYALSYSLFFMWSCGAVSGLVIEFRLRKSRPERRICLTLIIKPFSALFCSRYLAL